MGKRLEPGHYIVEDIYYELLDAPTKFITAEQEEILTRGGIIQYKGREINVYDGPFKIFPSDSVPPDVRGAVDVFMDAIRSLFKIP